MVEKAQRSRLDTDPRDDEWEVFARDDDSSPARHIGSVTAPDADAAHEQATQLFAWYADEVWVCPATELRRYSTEASPQETTQADPAVPNDGTESRTHEL